MVSRTFCKPRPRQRCHDVIPVPSNSAHNGRGEPITPATGRSRRACPTRFGGATSLGNGERVARHSLEVPKLMFVRCLLMFELPR